MGCSLLFVYVPVLFGVPLSTVPGVQAEWFGHRAAATAWMVVCMGLTALSLRTKERGRRLEFYNDFENKILMKRLNDRLQPTSAEVAVVRAAQLELHPQLVKYRIDRASIQLEVLLGSGAFGSVYKVGRASKLPIPTTIPRLRLSAHQKRFAELSEPEP